MKYQIEFTEDALNRIDDFATEVEALRNSQKFQAFLDERMKCKVRFPIEALEQELETELMS